MFYRNYDCFRKNVCYYNSECLGFTLSISACFCIKTNESLFYYNGIYFCTNNHYCDIFPAVCDEKSKCINSINGLFNSCACDLKNDYYPMFIDAKKKFTCFKNARCHLSNTNSCPENQHCVHDYDIYSHCECNTGYSRVLSDLENCVDISLCPATEDCKAGSDCAIKEVQNKIQTIIKNGENKYDGNLEEFPYNFILTALKFFTSKNDCKFGYIDLEDFIEKIISSYKKMKLDAKQFITFLKKLPYILTKYNLNGNNVTIDEKNSIKALGGKIKLLSSLYTRLFLSNHTCFLLKHISEIYRYLNVDNHINNFECPFELLQDIFVSNFSFTVNVFPMLIEVFDINHFFKFPILNKSEIVNQEITLEIFVKLGKNIEAIGTEAVYNVFNTEEFYKIFNNDSNNMFLNAMNEKYGLKLKFNIWRKTVLSIIKVFEEISPYIKNAFHSYLSHYNDHAWPNDYL